MTSQKMVAKKYSRDREVSGGHQGPMTEQNTNFAGCELHPQKLVRLVGCRDPNAGNREIKNAVSSVRGSNQPRSLASKGGRQP
jgi:hypothetical protein